MKEKIKGLAIGIGLFVLGIIFLIVEVDFKLMLLGVIPITTTVVGVIGIIVGAIWIIAELVSKKK